MCLFFKTQNHDYVVTVGASRKNERYEHEEGVTASVEGKAEKEKMASDPMFKLEHSVEDKEKSNDETPRIQLLQVREREEKDLVLYFSFPVNARRQEG